MTLPLPPSALPMARAADWPSFTLSEVTNATLGASVLLAKVTTGICLSNAAVDGLDEAGVVDGAERDAGGVLRDDLLEDRHLLGDLVLRGALVHGLDAELLCRSP